MPEHKKCLFIGGPWDGCWAIVDKPGMPYHVMPAQAHEPRVPFKEWPTERLQCLEQLEIEALTGPFRGFYLPRPNNGPLAEEFEKRLMTRRTYLPSLYECHGKDVCVYVVEGMKANAAEIQQRIAHTMN